MSQDNKFNSEDLQKFLEMAKSAASTAYQKSKDFAKEHEFDEKLNDLKNTIKDKIHFEAAELPAATNHVIIDTDLFGKHFVVDLASDSTAELHRDLADARNGIKTLPIDAQALITTHAVTTEDPETLEQLAELDPYYNNAYVISYDTLLTLVANNYDDELECKKQAEEIVKKAMKLESEN